MEDIDAILLEFIDCNRGCVFLGMMLREMLL